MKILTNYAELTETRIRERKLGFSKPVINVKTLSVSW
jgi:hypothetical protein